MIWSCIFRVGISWTWWHKHCWFSQLGWFHSTIKFRFTRNCLIDSSLLISLLLFIYLWIYVYNLCRCLVLIPFKLVTSMLLCCGVSLLNIGRKMANYGVYGISVNVLLKCNLCLALTRFQRFANAVHLNRHHRNLGSIWKQPVQAPVLAVKWEWLLSFFTSLRNHCF